MVRAACRRWSTVGGAAALLAVAVSSSPVAASPADPPYSIDVAELEAALDCTAFTDDREPVLLVHGTGTYGAEQWSWNHQLLLDERGFDHCTVTYPGRGLGDQQISAEYVAYAVQAIHERSGRKVDVVGHSQGASMPRWAIRFWPSVQAAVDDFVGLAGPYHGTVVVDALFAAAQVTGAPPAAWQFRTDSEFVRVVNAGDQTPGDIDYTSIYSLHDELVQPAFPEPVAALDFGREGPNVRNILVQDLCPGRVVDHLTIGLTDRLVFELVVDAFTNDGPADPARLDLTALCNLPDQILVPDEQLAAFAPLFESFAGTFPDLTPVSEEPPLRPYATGTDGPATGTDPGDDRSPDPPGQPTDPAAQAPGSSEGEAGDGTTGPIAARAPLPVTGGGAGLLGALALLAVLALRAGRYAGADEMSTISGDSTRR